MDTRFLLLAAPLLVEACTCSSPKLEGKVVDLWDNPVAGITVKHPKMEKGVLTDKDGLFAMPLLHGKYDVTAKGEGFIVANKEVTVPEGADEGHLDLRVIPEPDSNGFFLVGPEAYIKLLPQGVQRKGNETQSYIGVSSSGDAQVKLKDVPGEKLRLVFHTDELKMDEVKRLDIELHKLTFLEETEIKTVEGTAKVDLDLWTSAGTIPYEDEQVGSDDNYIFRIDEIPSGTYAFSSMHLLDPASAQFFDNVPDAVRLVHPFTIE